MCISQELFSDRNVFIDCLDASDEAILTIGENDCLTSPVFDCYTLTCSWLDFFSCGDGQCVDFHPLQTSS